MIDLRLKPGSGKPLETGPWKGLQMARRKHTPEQVIKKLR